MKSAAISSTDFRSFSNLPSGQTPNLAHRRVAERLLLLPKPGASLPKKVGSSSNARSKTSVCYTISASYGDKESDSVSSNEYTSPAKALRKLLESPGIHQGPACFDALSAKLVERAGFDFCFTTGMSFILFFKYALLCLNHFCFYLFGCLDLISHLRSIT